MTGSRAQSNVVGVALLLGIAVVSMGTLTATVGMLVDSNAAAADAERVAADFDETFEPVAATGPQRGTVTFSEGRLAAVDRTVEVSVDGVTVERIAADALVYEADERRVVFHAGAVVRGRSGEAWLETPPPITVDDDLIIVGVARLGDDVRAVSGSGGVTTTVRTNVSHSRTDLGTATVSVAVETAAPSAWERYFEAHGASVTRSPGDPPTVEATFEGDRTGYLVVHDLDAEVGARV